MRLPILALLAAMAAGAAAAQAPGGAPTPRTTQCIEADGRLIPAACRAQATRLPAREDICTCPKGGRQVDVAVCAEGQTPPAESRRLNAARRVAVRDGSLLGDTFEGRPICAAPRNRD